MSNSDSFIDEVTEEVQRDKLWAYAQRYGWIAVLLIVGIVGYVAWVEYSKSQRAAEAQALGDSINAAVSTTDAGARAEALGALAPTAGDASVIVNLRQAAALVEAEKLDEALAVYRQIAETSEDPIYADLAQLKALVLQGSAAPLEERLAALDALAAPGAPFRTLALEQKALALVDAGDKEGAIALLTELIEDSETSDGLRARAGQVLVALGGEIPATSRLLSSQ